MTLVLTDGTLGGTMATGGRFTARFPTAEVAGTAGGVLDRGIWTLTLMPDVPLACALPFGVAGSAAATLSPNGERLTGTVSLLACEGVSEWQATFVRQ